MSQEITNLHDAFFKHSLSDARSAATFLREHLPAKIVALLAPELPEADSTSFVDEYLAQHHSDLLFRLKMNIGSDTLAYVLFEHKSSPDPATPLQLLRYIVRVLAKWYDEHQQLPLPVVLPLVLHQGPKGWKSSTQFIDLFGDVPATLRRYLPSFQHALVDLARIADSKLSTDPHLSARLKAMKYVQRADLPHRLPSILAPELADVDIAQILHYIGNGPVDVSAEVFQAALRECLGQQQQERKMGFIQEFEARGFVKGEAKALLRLLEKRFGAATVTSEFRERVFAANVATLDAWLDRVIDADKLSAVFDTPR